jgi:hypothetical protein
MATRMQQRRGTAAQWTSTNAGAGPVLNAGEIGWESDTNKFKIGDGVNNWSTLDYFIDGNSTANPAFGSSITFEGATANDFETTVAVTDPTADRTITLPDATGTVVLADGSGNITVSGNLTVSGTTTTINSTTINATTGIVFEGATANDFETTLTVTDPTADRTITFPDDGGTVQLRVTDVSDTEIGYLNGVTSAIQTQMDAKAPLASPTFTGTVTLPANTISQSMMADDSVGTNEIGGLAVTTAKIADLNVTEGKLADGAVTNAKVSASAAIAQSKIDGLTTDLAAKAPLAGPALTGDATAVNLTISGNLTVNGTTTNLNSTNLVVEDKNIILADVETPTDTTADGGGITLKGTTDKTFNWVDSTDAWTSSEHINLASGKTLKYNGTDLVAAQSGNSGKYLTTDGTSTSWATVSGYSAPTLGSTSIASGATVTTIEGLTDIVLNGPGSVTDELTLLLMGAL